MGLITESNLPYDALETEQKHNDRYQMDIFENEATTDIIGLQSNKIVKNIMAKKKRAGTMKKNSKSKDMMKAKRGTQDLDDIKNEIVNQSIDELEESLYSKTHATHKSKKSHQTTKSKANDVTDYIEQDADKKGSNPSRTKRPKVEAIGQSIEDRVLIVNKSINGSNERKNSMEEVNYEQEL